MIRASIPEFQADLQHYLSKVAQGETVQLLDNDKAIAELRPLSSATAGPRPIGLAKGTFEVPATFFDPLPEDLLRAFNGEDA